VTDDRTGTIVLFGGAGFADTWTWNGERWTQRTPRRSPPSLTSTGPMPAMAYDGAGGRVLLFGGSRAGAATNDTWTWNVDGWTLGS